MSQHPEVPWHGEIYRMASVVNGHADPECDRPLARRVRLTNTRRATQFVGEGYHMH